MRKKVCNDFFRRYSDLSSVGRHCGPREFFHGLLALSSSVPFASTLLITPKPVRQNMVKVDIIRAVQFQMKIQFGEAELLVNQVLDLMKDALENGEVVLITGLGRFELRDKQARPGRDPRSKQAYEIAARRVVTFHPSKLWRDELNGKE